MTALVPNRLLMEFELPLRHRPDAPKIDGQLTGWTKDELLPPLCALDEQTPFADVYACWNDSGLFIAAQVPRKRRPLCCDPKVFWKSDHLRLCTDTRDARRNKRASRFCQQFFFLPTGGAKGYDPAGGSAKIQRARDDAPLFTSERNASPRLHVASTVLKDEYILEAQIPAACLVGFDPVEHPRIGFYYMLEDRDHGQQFLTLGDDLNWYVDPSTWPTAVLAR